MSGWDLTLVEQAFAEAAVDPSRWNAAMELATDVTGGYGAALIPLQGRMPQVPQSRSMAASFETYIKDGWIHRDERYRGLPIILRRGVFTDLDITTPVEMARHPYYQDFLAPHGLRWFAGVLVACGDEQWCLSIQRTIAQGPFSPRETRRLAGLSSKLSAAAALARALGFVRAEVALQAFEVSGSAVVLFDRSRQVLRANAAAERVLCFDPRIQRRRIVSCDVDATAALDSALHTVMWHRDGFALMAPVALSRAGKRPLLAYAVRLAAMSADAFASCRALLVLVDPDERPRPTEAALRTCFDLTAAEARLATRLAEGDALEGVANEFGIAYETARNQLKAIFSKTDTHRQAELMALLAHIAKGPKPS